MGTTPCGENHAFDLRNIARDAEDWYYELTTCEDAKYIDDEGKLQYAIPVEAIEKLKTMTNTQKQREYWCNYQTAIEGAVWENELYELRKDKRVTGISPQSMLTVYIPFDIGWGDATAFWMSQLVHNQIHLFNYYENNRKKPEHYAKIINDWNHGKDFKIKLLLPHDAKAEKMPHGISVLSEFINLGFDCEIVPAPKSDYGGLEAVREILIRCFLDDRNCKNGISAISSYHYEKNIKKSTADREYFSRDPVHDWSSHGSKALQTLALWIKLINPEKPVKENINNYAGYTTGVLIEDSDAKDGWLGV